MQLGFSAVDMLGFPHLSTWRWPPVGGQEVEPVEFSGVDNTGHAWVNPHFSIW